MVRIERNPQVENCIEKAKKEELELCDILLRTSPNINPSIKDWWNRNISINQKEPLSERKKRATRMVAQNCGQEVADIVKEVLGEERKAVYQRLESKYLGQFKSLPQDYEDTLKHEEAMKQRAEYIEELTYHVIALGHYMQNGHEVHMLPIKMDGKDIRVNLKDPYVALNIAINTTLSTINGATLQVKEADEAMKELTILPEKPIRSSINRKNFSKQKYPHKR